MAKLLEGGPTDAIHPDVCRSNGVSGMLGRGLVRKGGAQLRWNGGEESLEHLLIIVEINVAVLDYALELSSLHLHLHQ